MSENQTPDILAGTTDSLNWLINTFDQSLQKLSPAVLALASAVAAPAVMVMSGAVTVARGIDFGREQDTSVAVNDTTNAPERMDIPQPQAGLELAQAKKPSLLIPDQTPAHTLPSQSQDVNSLG